MQWPARSLIAPAPSHRHKTSIASISIAISIRGLGARVGTGRGQGFAFVGAAPSPFPDPCPRPLPSPCASHRPPIAISPPSLFLPSPLVIEGSARARALGGDGGSRSSGLRPRLSPTPVPARRPRPAPRIGLPSPLVHHRFGWRGLGGALAARLPSSSCPPPSPAVRTHRHCLSSVFGLSVVVSCPVRAWVSDFYCVRNPANLRPHCHLYPWPLGAKSESVYLRESDAEL